MAEETAVDDLDVTQSVPPGMQSPAAWNVPLPPSMPWPGDPWSDQGVAQDADAGHFADAGEFVVATGPPPTSEADVLLIPSGPVITLAVSGALMSNLYSGMTITLKARATDAVTQKVITDALGTFSLFAPPKQPKTNPSQRTPDSTVVAAFDAVSRYYLAQVSTTGFQPGTWWMLFTLVGGAGNYDAWDYTSFPLLQ